MLGARRDPQSGKNERSVRIEKIVASVMDQEDAGASIDDTEIEQRYAELMPELGEYLRTARAIHAVAEKARQEPVPSGPVEDRAAQIKDDLEWLGESLAGFEILERIDYGGQGAVYRAVQKAPNRIVAVKVLLNGPLSSPRQRHRFAREVDLISKLRHPNIVTLFESGAVRGRPFFAMEYVDGLPIDDYMLLDCPPVGECVRLFSKVCQAVSHAHQRGIIHRDLKPGNILVDEDDEPHILDFGLAKSIEDAYGADDEPSLSITGQVFGTLPYLSPEQARGSHDEIDVRSDIYTLGVILYRLLTGAFPYPVEGDREAVRANILTREPPSLRRKMSDPNFDFRLTSGTISDDLERIVLKALAKDKSRRYQSAVAFADDLNRYLAGDAVEAKADSSLYILKKTIRKYRVHTTIAAAFLVILGLSSVFVTAQWMRARAERDNARQIALLAHSTLDEVVREFEDSIRPLAGGMEVRDRLLKKMAVKLDLLRPLVESDASMAGVLAALREKQGDVAYAQGRHIEAAEHYQASLQVNRRLAQTEGADGDSRDALLLKVARAHRKLGLASTDSEAHFEEAIALAEEVVRRHPDGATARLELCEARINYAQHLFDAGRYERTAPLIDAVVALAESVTESESADRAWNKLLVAAYSLRGRNQLELGDGDSAVASLEASIGLLESLIDQRPSDVGLRHKLLEADGRLGIIHRDARRFDQAKNHLEKAITTGEYLRMVEPTVTIWKADLCSVHHQFSRLLQHAGDLEGAESHCEAAVQLAEELIQTERDNPEWLRILAFSKMRRGWLRFETDQLKPASADFEAALDIRKDLVQREPENAALKDDLAMTLDWLGKCSRRRKRAKNALTYYKKAYEIRQQLYKAQPDLPERALNLVLSQTKLATWHLDRRTPQADQAASELLQEARRSLLALRDADKLAGHERRHTASMDVIDRNLELIASREQECVKADEGRGVPNERLSDLHQP
jgi:serine/threonine protein kinase